MSEQLQYSLQVGVESGADVDSVEKLLQEVLLGLYDEEDVESIKVTKDGHTKDNVNMERLMHILDSMDSDEVKRAIDSVKTLERIDDE